MSLPLALFIGTALFVHPSTLPDSYSPCRHCLILVRPASLSGFRPAGLQIRLLTFFAKRFAFWQRQIAKSKPKREFLVVRCAYLIINPIFAPLICNNMGFSGSNGKPFSSFRRTSLPFGINCKLKANRNPFSAHEVCFFRS